MPVFPRRRVQRLVLIFLMLAAAAPTPRARRHRPGYIVGLVEIGAYLGGVSPDAVRAWIASGDLIAYRLGPRYIGCKVSDLDAFVAAGLIASAKPANRPS